ncbi:hypothetical protein Q7P37_004490 [Cladosporium fusiforme]
MIPPENAMIAINTSFPSGFIPDSPNKIPEPKIRYNMSFTLTGDCWDQWNQFWVASVLAEGYAYMDMPHTTIYTTTESDLWMSTSTFLSFFTTTVSAGQFAVTTYTTTALRTDYEWFGTPVSTWTTTNTSPKLSRCQKQWDEHWYALTGPMPYDNEGPSGCDAWATTTIPWSCHGPLSTWSSVRNSHNAAQFTPRCTQATLEEEYCNAAREGYISKVEAQGRLSDGAPIIDYTTQNISGTETSFPYWPSGRTISGPGCTLGCGSCAMQGGTVELIYWPAATTKAQNATAKVPFAPVTVETLGTTLTSPTTRCLIRSTIINPDVDNLQHKPKADAVGHCHPTGHVQEQHQWALCNGGMGGAYDPPLALRATDSIITPTVPSVPTTTSAASPAPTRSSEHPPETTQKPRPTNQPVSSAPPQELPGDESSNSEDGQPAPRPKDPDHGGHNRPPGADDTGNPIAHGDPKASKNPSDPGENSPNNPAHQEEIIDGTSPSAGHDGPSDQQAQDDPPSPEGALRTAKDRTDAVMQTAAVWTHVNRIFTAIPRYGAVLVQGSGKTTTIAAGMAGKVAGQKVSVPAAADKLVIDGMVATFGPAYQDRNRVVEGAQPKVFTQGGQEFTARMHGSSVVLEAAGSTTTLSNGATATLAEEVVSMSSSGVGDVYINGHAINDDSTGNDVENSRKIAVWTQGGMTFTAKMQGDSSAILEASSTRMTLHAGSTIKLGGKVISLPNGDGGLLVHDGITATFHLEASSVEPYQAVATVVINGETFLVNDIGSSVVILAGGSMVTLSDGAQTVLESQMIRVVSTAGVILVNGSATLTTSTGKMAILASGTRGAASTAGSNAEPSEMESSAFCHHVPVLLAVGMILFNCVL